MSRKVTTEQNDISIIIGNLPKRLQKKIAEDVVNGHNADTLPNELNALKIATNEGTSKVAEKVTKCDELKTPGRGAVQKGCILLKNQNIASSSKTADSVPGILRINGSTEACNGGHSKQTPIEQKKSTERMEKQKLKSSRLNAEFANNHPEWFNVLEYNYSSRMSKLYQEYMDLLHDGNIFKYWEQFLIVHNKIRMVLKELLMTKLKFCVQEKIDTYFWKILFHNVQESIKRQTSYIYKLQLQILYEDGEQFYSELFEHISSKYLTIVDIEDDEQQKRHPLVSIARVAAQKILIYLGDLCRYKAKLLLETNGAVNLDEAAKYYKRAQMLLPANGIPYNQLAITTLYSGKYFDSIYYHMRSLMSSNAIVTAKESLLAIFDKIRKMYVDAEQKKSPAHSKAKAASKSIRKEVWIYPDGIRSWQRTSGGDNESAQDEVRLNELSLEQLQRGFTLLYLYLIGKLYTGIDIENVQELIRKMLIQLKVLLSRSPLGIARPRIMKIVALNIFVLELNKQNSRLQIRRHAFNMCNQMFGVVLRECNNKFITFSDDYSNIDKDILTDLNTMLQFIKIYIDWLSLNVAFWRPVRSNDSILFDCWHELEQLFSFIKFVQNQNNSINVELDKKFVLEEDNFLVGFLPLSRVLCKFGSNMEESTELEQFYKRIGRIANSQYWYDEMCKSIELMEDTDENEFDWKEWNDDLGSAINKIIFWDGNFPIDESSENTENIIDNSNVPTTTKKPIKDIVNIDGISEDSQILQLSKLKKKLEEKANEKNIYKAKLQEILKYVETDLYIEVRPKYLLPDTNCFIDSIEQLMKLSNEFCNYTLVIPLTVVKELDGLSKGVKLEYTERMKQQRIHHFDDVSTRAMKSLDFINKSKSHKVKCATTKGSIINASLFALVEEESMSNDDKILTTALALSKTMSSESSKDGKCCIQTELVLITTDRNLRVKALSRNLAVSELNEFLHWAKNSTS